MFNRHRQFSENSIHEHTTTVISLSNISLIFCQQLQFNTVLVSCLSTRVVGLESWTWTRTRVRFLADLDLDLDLQYEDLDLNLDSGGKDLDLDLHGEELDLDLDSGGKDLDLDLDFEDLTTSLLSTNHLCNMQIKC